MPDQELLDQKQIIQNILSLTKWMRVYEVMNNLPATSQVPDANGLCFGLSSMVLTASAISEDIRQKVAEGKSVGENADTVDNVFSRFSKIARTEVPKSYRSPESKKTYQEVQLFLMEVMQGQYGVGIADDKTDVRQEILSTLNTFAPHSVTGSNDEYFQGVSLYKMSNKESIVEWAQKAQSGDGMYVMSDNHGMAVYVTRDENGNNMVGLYDPNVGRIELSQKDITADNLASFDPFRDEYFTASNPLLDNFGAVSSDDVVQSQRSKDLVCIHVAPKSASRSNIVIGGTTANLLDIEYAKVESVTSRNAQLCYRYNYCALDDLKSLSIEQIHALTSPQAQTCYDRKYCTFNDLKDKTPEEIDALTSPNAQLCYACKYFDVETLRSFELEKVLLLTKAWDAYITESLNPSDAKNLTVQQMTELFADTDRFTKPFHDNPQLANSLVSAAALNCYMRGYCAPHDLKILTTAQIDVLISEQAQTCYDRKYCTFNDLKDKTPEEIATLTSGAAQTCYGHKYCTFNDLKDKTPEQIYDLTSTSAQECYKVGAKVEDLKNKTPEQIQVLMSQEARECYKQGYCTFNDLKDKTLEQISALTSEWAQECFKSGYCNVEDLKGATSEQIQLLTSPYAQECYQQGYCKVQDLKDQTPEQIQALTVFAQECYKQGYCNVEDLKDQPPGKIIVMTSESLQQCYRAGLSVDNVQTLDMASINILDALVSGRVEDITGVANKDKPCVVAAYITQEVAKAKQSNQTLSDDDVALISSNIAKVTGSDPKMASEVLRNTLEMSGTNAAWQQTWDYIVTSVQDIDKSHRARETVQRVRDMAQMSIDGSRRTPNAKERSDDNTLKR